MRRGENEEVRKGGGAQRDQRKRRKEVEETKAERKRRGGAAPNMWRQLFQAKEQSMTQQKAPDCMLDLMRSEGLTLGAHRRAHKQLLQLLLCSAVVGLKLSAHLRKSHFGCIPLSVSLPPSNSIYFYCSH